MSKYHAMSERESDQAQSGGALITMVHGMPPYTYISSIPGGFLHRIINALYFVDHAIMFGAGPGRAERIILKPVTPYVTRFNNISSLLGATIDHQHH
jgi:hypothetical protein